MKPTDLEKLFKAMRTEAPSRLDLRVYDTIDNASSQTVHSLSLWRKIMRSPITKLAVAAVFIVGCLFLVRQLKGGDSASDPQPTIVKTVEPKETLPINELALAQNLYAQKDLPGLLSLLETGQLTTRVTIAEFLEEIGDESVLPALQRFADVWQGEGVNPFEKAIDRIAERLQKGLDSTPSQDVSEEVKIPPNMTLEAELSNRTSGTGVVDGIECTGILRGDIQYSGPRNSWVETVAILPMTLDRTGSIGDEFKLPWSRERYAQDHPLQMMVINDPCNLAVIVSVEDPNQRTNVTLLPAHRITGQVIDADGFSRPDTWIAISLISEFTCSLPIAYSRTDTEGRFTSKSLPTEQIYEIQLTYPERLDYDLYVEHATLPTNQIKIEEQSDSLIDLGYITCFQKEPNNAAIQQETPDWMKSFYEFYALKDGEDLKLIKAPYIPERQDFLVHNLPPARLRSHTHGLYRLSWEWNGTELIYMELNFTTARKAWRLEFVLEFILKIQSYDAEPLDGLFLPEGEWVVRQGISEQEKLRALEDILREEGFAIQFEKHHTGEGVNGQGEPSYVWVPIYTTAQSK